MDGPYAVGPFSNLRTSPIGIVPKKTGGWRLITHLSAPVGYSINDFIDTTFVQSSMLPLTKQLH